MEFTLERAYYKEGTNGTLFIAKQFSKKIFLSHTIELPWRNNQKNISCIPEGTYMISTRYSKKFGNHLLVENVACRSLILLHPANNAKKELEGCIAPVSYLNGIGEGVYSRKAMKKLLSLVSQAEARKEMNLLTIKSVNYEHCRTL